MFWQKEPKNLKIIVLIIVMCVVFGTIFLIYSQKKPKKSELPSEIEVIETEAGKIVRNRAEGYEVTIPKEWHINYFKPKEEKHGELSISSEKVNAPLEMSVKGIFFDIQQFDNFKKLTLEEWVEKNSKKGLYDRIIYKKIETINGKPVLIEKVYSDEGIYLVAYFENGYNIVQITGVTFIKENMEFLEKEFYKFFQNFKFNF
jgi:hypothetical protein